MPGVSGPGGVPGGRASWSSPSGGGGGGGGSGGGAARGSSLLLLSAGVCPAGVPPPSVQCRRPTRGERRHAHRHPPPLAGAHPATRSRWHSPLLRSAEAPSGGAPPPGPPAALRRSGRHASVWQRRARRRACSPPRRLLRGRGVAAPTRRPPPPRTCGRGSGRGGECPVFRTRRLREFRPTRWASPARRPIRAPRRPCVVRTRVRPRACARARAPPRAPHSRSVADPALVGAARLRARARARARYNARAYATAGVCWCSRRAAELHPLGLCFALVSVPSRHPPPRGLPAGTPGHERRPFRLCTGGAPAQSPRLVSGSCARVPRLRSVPPE